MYEYVYSRGHVYTMPCAAYFVQCSCDLFDRQARLTENCLKSRSLNWMLKWNQKTDTALYKLRSAWGTGRQAGRHAGRQAGRGTWQAPATATGAVGLACVALWLLSLRPTTFPHPPPSSLLPTFHVPGAFNERIFHLSEHCEVISKWLFFDTWGNTCIAFDSSSDGNGGGVNVAAATDPTPMPTSDFNMHKIHSSPDVDWGEATPSSKDIHTYMCTCVCACAYTCVIVCVLLVYNYIIWLLQLCCSSLIEM